MYQSPVAAIAELIANSWDADAETVEVFLPDKLGSDAEIVIKDDGVGMTFNECQSRYLNVGLCRRLDDVDEHSTLRNRPILGRKGIGKFAGFGISEIIELETISRETGEKTSFSLNLSTIRGNEYIDTEGVDIDVISYEPPDSNRTDNHGTRVKLISLNLTRRPSHELFTKSMARRFVIHEGQADFKILVNGTPLPNSFQFTDAEFVFPRDYETNEMPIGLLGTDSDGWGTEKVGKNREIRWRFVFHKETIDEEELRGISVFARGKMAQSPFLFNLTGGLGGQHGVEYLTGQVEADFLDELDDDLIATERQRINWEHEESRAVLDWGQTRVKELLRIWRDRRGATRVKELESKVAQFSRRLDRLGRKEANTVRSALRKLAQVPTLSREQFEELGDAVLTAWEQGRLHELIRDVASIETVSEEELLKLLLEAQVLTALNMAEAVKTKILTVGGLKLRVKNQELEDAVRNYIAENPWLLSPEWETFRVERSVKKLMVDAAKDAELFGEDWKGRVDLALASGGHLLIVEFMRPGLQVDWDHLNRFERYVRYMRSNVESNTGGRFKEVTGLIVADKLKDNPVIHDKIRSLALDRMVAQDWSSLLSDAEATWSDFLECLASREPKDERLRALLENRSGITVEDG